MDTEQRRQSFSLQNDGLSFRSKERQRTSNQMFVYLTQINGLFHNRHKHWDRSRDLTVLLTSSSNWLLCNGLIQKCVYLNHVVLNPAMVKKPLSYLVKENYAGPFELLKAKYERWLNIVTNWTRQLY